VFEKGPYLGAHMSIAGGVHLAVERAQKIEAQALQVFTKSSNQWFSKPLDLQNIQKFQEARKEAKLKFAFAHDAYLINLASPDSVLWEKSIKAFSDEMDRAHSLGLDFIVFHPGAHMRSGVDPGCSRIAQAMNQLLDQKKDYKLMLLLENAAGQGTTLGRTFEELAQIWNQVEDQSRVGFCFDTCHAFAAGYDIRTSEGFSQTMKKFDEVIGVRHIKAFHLNDSKKGLECRVDRHEHIGKGQLGVQAFRWLLTDQRFKDCPMVLETPKSEDLHEDRENLKVLRSLLTN